ncbi:hypothetical protein [Nonomuraea longispora]|nr:hypothetical protein [Nonomuraea longispora]
MDLDRPVGEQDHRAGRFTAAQRPVVVGAVAVVRAGDVVRRWIA